MTPITRRALIRTGSFGAIGLAGALVGGAGATLAIAGGRYAGRFLPGMTVGGVDLGGKTWSEAVAIFDGRWAAFLQTPLVLRLDSLQWKPTAEEIGLSVDYLTPLAEAYKFGRTGGIAGRLSQQREAVSTPHSWPIRVRYRPQSLYDYLDGLAAGVRREPVDASLELIETSSARRFVLRPSLAGRRLIGLEAARDFDFDLDRPETILIDLRLEVADPAVETEPLRQIVSEASSLLEGRIRLIAPDATWEIDRARLVGAMTLDDSSGRLVPRFEFTGDEFTSLLDEIESVSYREPVEPRIKYDIETAGFTYLTEPVNGSRLDRDILLRRLEIAAANGDSSVELPIVVTEPRLVRADPDSLGLTGNFGIGSSFFWGSSWNRAYNIKLGAEKLDGTIIEPGEVFDFNEALGPIEYETGFVDGLIIINNKTIPGIGGGICQVSTTMFRAAFMAGLPISERWQHVYRVSYYELGEGNLPGFDASIYQPTLNLQFTNDTDNYLMIRSEYHADAGRLRFYLIGSPKRRVAERNFWSAGASEPGEPRFEANPELAPGEREQTDWPIWGLRAGVVRKVFLNDELLFEDEFVSNFRAWSARWEIGPDADGNIDTTGLTED